MTAASESRRQQARLALRPPLVEVVDAAGDPQPTAAAVRRRGAPDRLGVHPRSRLSQETGTNPGSVVRSASASRRGIR